MSVWLTILSPSCCIYLSVCSIHAQRLTGHNHHALHALKCSTMPPKLDSTHARMHTCTCTQWSTSVCVNSQNKCWTLVDFASLSLSVGPACMSLVCIPVCLWLLVFTSCLPLIYLLILNSKPCNIACWVPTQWAVMPTSTWTFWLAVFHLPDHSTILALITVW